MIVRVYNFNNVTVRDNTKIDDELDNIISFLDGSALDEVILVVDDDIEPPLTNVAISKNPSFDIRKDNSTKVYLCNKNGSIESLISTGVAPFDIASTTLCTNLNAHYLDDIDGSKFNSQELTGQFFLGNLIIEKLTTGSNNLSVLQDGDILKLRRSSDNDSILEVQDFDESTRIISLPSDLNVKVEYNPITSESATNNTNFDVLRYTDLLTKENKLWFAGVKNSLTAGQTDVPIAAYICGLPLTGLAKLKKLSCWSSASGGLTIKLYKNGTLQSTLTISVGATANTAYTQDLDINVVLDDVFTVKCDTVGNAGYVLVGVIGET